MATAHLRKAFRYVNDSDDDEPVEGIDEEEQEKIISSIHEQDTKHTVLYTRIFLILPLCCAAAYLPTIYNFASLLAVTSLLASAYILFFIPLIPNTPRSNLAYMQNSDSWQTWRQWFDEEGPVNQYITLLNGLLSAVVGLQGYARGRNGGWADGEGLWSALPLVVFIIILVVRTQLRPVDVKELEKLRYRYKGA